MTTTATHNDATDMASTQGTLSEYLSISVEAEEAPDEEPAIDPSVDLDIEVCVGKGRDHYHMIRVQTPDGAVVSACPHKNHEVISLKEAIEANATPCGVCEPIDWRANTDATGTTEGV